VFRAFILPTDKHGGNDHDMANRDLWQLESALGLDIDDLGRLDETCRALNPRLRALVIEAVELVRMYRTIDLTPFRVSMVEGGFSDDDAWSKLDDIEEAVALPEITDLFDLVSILTHVREESRLPDQLRYLARRTGFESIETLFPGGRMRDPMPAASDREEDIKERGATPALVTRRQSTTMTAYTDDRDEQPEELQQLEDSQAMPAVMEASREPRPVMINRRANDPSLKFITRYPNLVLLRNVPIDSWELLPQGIEPFATRTRNAMRRLKIERWGQLLEISENDFAALPNVGITSVIDLVRVLDLLQDDLTDLANQSDGDNPATAELNMPPALVLARRFNDDQLQALLTIGKWANLLGGSRTLGSILSGTAPMPDDVHDAVALIRNTVVDSPVGSTETVRAQARTLLDSLDERLQLILRNRHLDADQQTLEELGEPLNITRERVRQLESEAFGRIDAALATEQFDELRWTAWRVAAALGTKAPIASDLTKEIVRSICGLELDEPAFDVIRLINRIRIVDEWFVTGPLPEVKPAFVQFAPEGFLPIEKFDDVLWGLGIESLFRDEILEAEPDLIVRADHVLLDTMPVQNKAFAILTIIGEPRSIDEILEALDQEYNVASVRNQLHLDDRIFKVSRYEWALSTWDLSPFTNVADAIAEEIISRGGEASLAEITPLIVERGGVRPGSVRAYSTAPMFELTGDVIRLRSADNPLIVEPSLDRAPNASLVDGTTLLFLNVRVDREVLRGSGRPAERGLAAMLGVQPGGSREFLHPEGSVRVTWPMTGWQGGTIGSLRQLVLDAGAVDGSTVRIVFDLAGSTIAAELVRDRSTTTGS